MNNKGQVTVGVIVIMIMGIFVALAFIPQIFNTQNTMTDKQQITNEAINIAPARLTAGDINTTYQFTLTNAPSGWKTTGCPLTSVVYGNSSTDYTLTTDYLITASTGVLTLKNSTAVRTGGNNTVIDYKYCADGYNTNSGSRGIAKLIGLFTVLALLGFVVYYVKFEF